MNQNPFPIDPLNGVVTDYIDASNIDLLERWLPFGDWMRARLAAGYDPYAKVNTGRIGPRVAATDRAGRPMAGLNFAAQDYLSLSSHPAVVAAARDAAQTFGVHSAGSSALMGLSTLTTTLEEIVARFVRTDEALVFPTGWGAGYAAIRALVRPTDHIVIDMLAHNCLTEAAFAATPNVHRFPHCSTDGVARRLERLRAEHPDAGILVVTEGIFSMDADIPDIAALQTLARYYRATLLVDVAHDLGATGKDGRGTLADQDMLGKVDVVMGSFSKTFAGNGGFVASNHPGLKLALRLTTGPQTFTNAMSPVQAAAVSAAFGIVDSPEGQTRRKALADNSHSLRRQLADARFEVFGLPGPIVPVRIGSNAFSRRLTASALASGAIVNLIEYPAVARNACRWRLQVMADHSPTDLADFVQIVTAARDGLSIHPDTPHLTQGD